MSHALAETLPPPMSLEEWAALPEDEPGEVVDGHWEEEEVPSYLHELLVMLLGNALGSWIFPRGGLVAGSEAKLAIRPDRGRKPDLTVYFPGRRPPARGIVRTPPDIAVEVVSPQPSDGRRDRVDKMADYAAFGIRYYWIVDPQLRSFEVFELTGEGRYIHALGASGGQLDAIPGCEGLRINLDAMWETVDRLENGS